jgi:hypothetical protein
MAGISASDKGNNYHLLSRSLGQGVPIAQIVDLNVLDVVSICDVNFGIQLRCALGRWGLGILCRAVGLFDNVRRWGGIIEVIVYSQSGLEGHQHVECPFSPEAAR